MRGDFVFMAELAGYVLAGAAIMRLLRGGARDLAFALLNVAALGAFFFRGHDSRLLPTFAAYLALAAVSYAALRAFVNQPGSLPWIAFFTPLAALAFVRYVPPSVYGGPHLPYGPFFIGISYLAFRNSLLVLEVRNGAALMPSFCRYLGYCFFVPTMSVGPINPYSVYEKGFGAERPALPAWTAFMRMTVGVVKYKFFGPLLAQLDYSNLLLDDHYHHWIDVPVAMVAYYLFLYANFSGFCDIAIGAAGLIGIPVAENFENPLAARNMREFWNRWHITLSQYMRDVVFAPLSKWLVGSLGPARANFAIALAITATFLLIGIWHGVGWNYATFGLAQAVGVVTVHYYTIFLKKRLGREKFKAYQENNFIHAAAVAATFLYYAATLALFANTFPQLRQIWSVLRW